MDTIDANHSDCREVARKMLLKWKQKKGKEATVGILLIALEEIERRDVVEKLLDQRDTMEKDQASQRRSGMKVQQRYDATSSDKPFEQAPVTEIHIWSIRVAVGAEWRHLGAVLGLESALMDNIDADHSAYREKAWKVLQKWKQKEGNGATVGILINALEEIGRRDVIEKLRDM
ncbi:unnamed protein product [Pocillopora meandrina]|uniref:Death domain-containing protein n=1 Tax=Pocillopora meandrina TaxID=46732 RepID=A0AAU9XGI6_9CNID|nr:unnamed protein product [Pocillopora meandrina]